MTENDVSDMHSTLPLCFLAAQRPSLLVGVERVMEEESLGIVMRTGRRHLTGSDAFT